MFISPPSTLIAPVSIRELVNVNDVGLSSFSVSEIDKSPSAFMYDLVRLI